MGLKEESTAQTTVLLQIVTRKIFSLAYFYCIRI